MKFRITDLFKSRKTKSLEVHKHTPSDPGTKHGKQEVHIPDKRKDDLRNESTPRTCRSIYSHKKTTYRNVAGVIRWGSSTKNQSQLNLKYRSKRRKKNRKARQQRAINRKAA